MLFSYFFQRLFVSEINTFLNITNTNQCLSALKKQLRMADGVVTNNFYDYVPRTDSCIMKLFVHSTFITMQTNFCGEKALSSGKFSLEIRHKKLTQKGQIYNEWQIPTDIRVDKLKVMLKLTSDESSRVGCYNPKSNRQNDVLYVN